MLHLLAAFGDQVAAVFEEFAAFEERRDRRVGEEVVVQVRGGLAFLRQIVQARDDADGDGLPVRVHESAAGHALRAVSDHRVGRAFVPGEVEAAPDRLLVRADDGFDAHREVGHRLLRADAGAARDEGVDAVGGDDHSRTQLVLPRPDADEPAALADEAVDLDPRHNGGAGLLGLLGQPRVELGAQNRDRIDRFGQPRVPVVDVDEARRVEEAQAVAGDAPLHRRLLDEIREHLLHDTAVEHSAGKVLRAGFHSALDEQDFPPFLRQLVRTHRSGNATADHDDVEIVVLLGHRAYFAASTMAGRASYRSATMP